MSTCEGPDCTHPIHHVHQTAKKIVDLINESDEAEKAVERDLKKELAFLIARERAAARPLTVAEAQGLEGMTPEGREEYLEERAKKYKAAVNLSPRDCFTGEFTVNTATAGQVINIAVSALRKIGGGSGLGAKLEARQALMQMQKICEENKMIPRAPENKSSTDSVPNPNPPINKEDWEKTEKVETSLGDGPIPSPTSKPEQER